MIDRPFLNMVKPATADIAKVNHLLLELQSVKGIQSHHSQSANEGFVIAVVSVTPGSLRTYWNTMRADSRAGKKHLTDHMVSCKEGNLGCCNIKSQLSVDAN